ncbi:MAG TPA: hypothetical protein VGG27_14360 [Magnetospirillaceae bacterium]|jgi:hypothetical protein
MPNVDVIRAISVLGLIALAGCQSGKPGAATSSSPAIGPSSEYSQEGQEELQPQNPKKQTAMIAPSDKQRSTADKDKLSDAESPDVGAVGLEESRIRGLFGEPVSEVDDAPAKKLSYRMSSKIGACSLEFTLYPDVDSRTYRTLTLEVRNDDGTAKGQRICVADLKSRIEDRRQEAR